ncbi:MAG TPA: hypothetical protein VH763_12715 [Gemmatimonadales bacterium]|jgi:hypothetical protein
MARTWRIAFGAVLLAGGLSGVADAQHPRGYIRMPSGDSLPVWNLTRYPVRHDSMALVLDYETRIELRDTTAVQREIITIWPLFRPAVEQAGLWTAAIRAVRFAPAAPVASDLGAPRGRPVNLYGVVFRRNVRGSWYLLGDTVHLN